MVSTAAEIDNLGLNLKKVQEKFMEWTGDTFKRSYLEDKKNHENMMLLNGKEKMKHLEETINQYHIQSEKNLEVLRQRADEVANLESELRELQITAERLVQRREQTEKNLEGIEHRLKKRKNEITSKEQSSSFKIKQFTKGTEFFKERLGLAFKKVDEDNLQFVFKFIDPNDEEKPFVFTVSITNQGTYSVKNCMPEVKELDEMVQQLNSTNNFSKFVVSMRRRFKDYVTASNKTSTS
ncbi:unnamed protein product [Porites lobata]|uniref:Kinetochore protein SPC25 n=1 Tax=Porites lobata TaxID=104759 RepID=A0ABN8RDV1_9CNID|nr:unnamed protein product [Porites lobata]